MVLTIGREVEEKETVVLDVVAKEVGGVEMTVATELGGINVFAREVGGVEMTVAGAELTIGKEELKGGVIVTGVNLNRIGGAGGIFEIFSGRIGLPKDRI